MQTIAIFSTEYSTEELIAPMFVEFYDKEWNEIGTKSSLCDHISEVTGIDSAILRGSDPTEKSIAERMSWAASRSTTRVEDAAYCLMGLFDVFMPMLYGEGSRAFIRLQEEIMKQSEDYTIFAWKASFMSSNYRGLFAHSPDEFLGGSSVIPRDYNAGQEPQKPPTMTSRGLLIDLPLLRHNPNVQNGKYMAWIGSSKHNQHNSGSEEESILCIWLQSTSSIPETFVRISPGTLEVLPKPQLSQFTRKRIYVLPFLSARDQEDSETDQSRSGVISVHHSQDSGVQPLNMPPYILDRPYLDLNWKADSKELLYSYRQETIILYSFILKKDDDEAVVLVGFRKNMP